MEKKEDIGKRQVEDERPMVAAHLVDYVWGGQLCGILKTVFQREWRIHVSDTSRRTEMNAATTKIGDIYFHVDGIWHEQTVKLTPNPSLYPNALKILGDPA